MATRRFVRATSIALLPKAVRSLGSAPASTSTLAHASLFERAARQSGVSPFCPAASTPSCLVVGNAEAPHLARRVTPHLGGGPRRPAEELPPHACEWLRRRSRVQPVQAAGGQMGGVLKQGEAACSTRRGAARGAAAAGASPRRLVEHGETPRLWGGLRRAPEATARSEAAQATLRGAWERPGPSDGPGRRVGRCRQTGWTALSAGCPAAEHRLVQHLRVEKAEPPQLWGGLSRAAEAAAGAPKRRRACSGCSVAAA